MSCSICTLGCFRLYIHEEYHQCVLSTCSMGMLTSMPQSTKCSHVVHLKYERLRIQTSNLHSTKSSPANLSCIIITHHATACNVSSWSYPFSTTRRMNPACYHCHQKCQSTVKVLMALSFYQLGKLLIYTKYLIAPWVIACEDCRHLQKHM